MKGMSKGKRRVLWVVLNLGALAGVAWSGYFDGPQVVANLVTFYAWIFLGASVLLSVVYRAFRWAITATDKEEAEVGYSGAEALEKAQAAQAKVLGLTASMPDRLSMPRWLDRTYDWVMALALVGAGWFVVATVWLLGIWVQHGVLKIVDELTALHWEKVEESLGVKL